jgi:uncharacterized membrane protein YgcG
MHHVHISTEFLFVLALLCIGLAWVVGWAVVTTRRDRRAAERAWTAPEYDTTRRSTPPVQAHTPPVGYTAGSYAQPAPTVVHSSGSNDLLTGVMVGSLLSGGHSHHDTTTIIHDSSPTYVDSSPSYDSGFSYSDSGSSSSFSDSGSSSGGLDASW